MKTPARQVYTPSQNVQSSSRAADRLRRFGLRLIWLRKRRGWSQRALARRLGIHSSTLSRYEAATHEPGLHILLRLAEIFGLSLDQLVRGEPRPGPERPEGP